MQSGTRLGRYEIIAELGTGGMATVYLGRALSVAGFQRLVAIKFLHPHLLKDEQFVEMFLDEGRLAARIHHPNVVATLDLEHSVDGIYIVSEYIEGDQLLGLYKAARAHEKRIPAGVSLRIALDVLAGLHAAHELRDDHGSPLKIVHRDVSPHNILVGSDGISRLTDFGIAKAEERITNTREGIVKGKLSYMAPEQPNDEPVDRRSDLFSMGTVLWECLTGRRLFPGKTDGEVLKALLHAPIPRLRDAAPELSEALDAVLARALARDPEQRFNTAAEFADALEAAAKPGEVATCRAVAEYVKETAASKIVAEHQRRRATTRDLPVFREGTRSSQVRSRSTVPPPGRPSLVPSPSVPPLPPGTVDEAPTQLQVTAPGSLPGRVSVPPPPLPAQPDDAHTDLDRLAASSPTSRAPAPLVVPKLPTEGDPDISFDDVTTRAELPAAPAVVEPVPLVRAVSRPPTVIVSEPPRRRSLTALFALVLVLGSALGVAVWWFTLRTSHTVTRMPSNETTSVVIPQPVATAEPEATTAPAPVVPEVVNLPPPVAPDMVFAPSAAPSSAPTLPRRPTPPRAIVTPRVTPRVAAPTVHAPAAPTVAPTPAPTPAAPPSSGQPPMPVSI